MKSLIISILSILIGIGTVVASFFYLIPKIKKTPTKFTTFIDKIISWISTNWIWCIVILLVILLIFIIVYIALAQKGKI